MSRAAQALTVATMIAWATAASAGEYPFLGEVDTFAFSFCPKGWAPLQGQLMAISTNQALFSLLGTTYGGDGRATFALPTAKTIFTLKEGQTLIQCIALQGIYPTQN
jgi:microcystin-dependent protein